MLNVPRPLHKNTSKLTALYLSVHNRKIIIHAVMVDNASYSQQIFVSTCVGLLSVRVRTCMHIDVEEVHSPIVYKHWNHT